MFVATKGLPLFAPGSVVSTDSPDPKQELNDQLFEAVRKGDAAAVTAALDRGADVNAKFRYGATALFKAAERGNAEVVEGAARSWRGRESERHFLPGDGDDVGARWQSRRRCSTAAGKGC